MNGSDSIAGDEGEIAGSPSGSTGIEYDVPEGSPARTCEDCGRPFPDEELLALHRGLEHEDRLSPADRETVETVRSAESKRLRLFRLKALAALVVLYFGLLMVYAVVT